jgi:transcriptional regulator with XRE-family HTH domain
MTGKYDIENIAERITALRKSTKLSQYLFAEKIGLREKAYAHYERGRNTPTLANLITICNVFDVDINYFIETKGETKDGITGYLD